MIVEPMLHQPNMFRKGTPRSSCNPLFEHQYWGQLDKEPVEMDKADDAGENKHTFPAYENFELAIIISMNDHCTFINHFEFI